LYSSRETELPRPSLAECLKNNSWSIATHTRKEIPRDFEIFAWCTQQDVRKYNCIVKRPRSPYINFVVRCDYSSPGRTGSTSTLPCAVTTRHPAARALRQPCRAPRLLVTRPHGLYVNLAVRRGYSSLGRSGSTSNMLYATATSSSGRTTTSTSLNQNTSRGRLPRHQQLVGSTSD
jgi:hypothetical protein